MKMLLDWDEYYPIYILNEDDRDDRYSVEVSQELWDRYNAAWSAFNEIQRELDDMRRKIENGS
jgi:hypothetical protein